MISVLCVRFGTKYGREYVERLRNMVARHLTVPYEFVCLTDDQHPIEGVRSIVQPHAQYAKGWWHKVHMFDPSLPIEGRIIYFDLDVVIHGNIDKLVEDTGNTFYGIRDFNRKFVPKWDKLNSSIMSWQKGTHDDIFHKFMKSPGGAMRLHGDQDWIYQIAGSQITYWPDIWIQSYKWEIRSRNEVDFSQRTGRTFRTIANPKIPKECCVCVFHGEPNPDAVQDPYVLDNWR